MPHKVAPLTPRQKAAEKAAKTRKILKGANLRDSDDEDDEPWEWIYSGGREEVADSEEESSDEMRTPRKRKARNVKTYVGGTIVGARKGAFRCKVGDTVCLRSDAGQNWAAIIWKFCEQEDEDGHMEKAADFLCKELSRA